MRANDTNIFYLPSAYLHRVRLERDLGRILSWWFLLVVPTLGYYLLAQSTWGLHALIAYALLAAAVVPYYELGYMLNDTYATRREQHPTLRISPEKMAYFYNHVSKIIILRMVWVCSLLFIYGLWDEWSLPAVYTMVGTLLLLPIFLLYNWLREGKAVLFYPVLVSSRYLVFLIPLWGTVHLWKYALLMLLAYPIEICIERYSMPGRRYGLMARLLPNEGSKQGFRAAYYICILLLLSPVWVQHPLWGVPIGIIAVYRWVRLAYSYKKTFKLNKKK